jgi:hypothetical protein
MGLAHDDLVERPDPELRAYEVAFDLALNFDDRDVPFCLDPNEYRAGFARARWEHVERGMTEVGFEGTDPEIVSVIDEAIEHADETEYEATVAAYEGKGNPAHRLFTGLAYQAIRPTTAIVATAVRCCPERTRGRSRAARSGPRRVRGSRRSASSDDPDPSPPRYLPARRRPTGGAAR